MIPEIVQYQIDKKIAELFTVEELERIFRQETECLRHLFERMQGNPSTLDHSQLYSIFNAREDYRKLLDVTHGDFSQLVWVAVLPALIESARRGHDQIG